jgi:quinol monooxygenase YgiN
MVSRIVTCTIDPARVNEFRSALNNKFVPRIRSQPGFIENIESLDPTTGQFCCVTLWRTESDVEKYHAGLFQEVAENLGPLMKGGPTVQTLPVENSSTHNIQAGRAAA